MMNVSPRNILVLSLAGIGNTLLATPMLRRMKEKRPLTKLSVLVMFEGSAEVLRYNPFVDEVLHWDFIREGWCRSFLFLRRLRQKGFDLILHVYPSNRKEYNLIGWFLGGTRQIGHRYRHDNFRNLNFLKGKTLLEDDSLHDAQENLRLLQLLEVGPAGPGLPRIIARAGPGPLELYLSKEEEAFAQKWLQERQLTDKRLVAFHTGSALFKNHVRRRWAPERFAQVADRLAEEKDTAILLLGGREDEEANDRCTKVMKTTPHLVRGRRLLETAALLARCQLLVTNDSALMHAAAALCVPTVAIFGPTNPASVRPFEVRHRVVRKELPCSPCFFYSPRPLQCYRKEKDFACLNWIEPDEVTSAALSLLKEREERKDFHG